MRHLIRFTVWMLGGLLLVTVTGSAALAQTGTPEPTADPGGILPSDTADCGWVLPRATDASIDRRPQPHYVCHDADSVAAGEGLLVFLPGTGGLPSDYRLFVEEAAATGLHAIGLTYPNPRSVNLQICPRDPDPACHELVRREVITGEDLHPGIDIDATNSITGRLVSLLRFLAEQQPGAGWDAYLTTDANGATVPRWDAITVAGHSQGAGMAAFIAHENLVARAVLFAWTDVSQGVVAPWILEAHATPPERIFYFDHAEDRLRGQAAREAMFDGFGIAALGLADVDTQAPPYNGAHVLVTAIESVYAGERESAAAHNVVVVDVYTPVSSVGGPVLAEVWRYLLGGYAPAA